MLVPDKHRLKYRKHQLHRMSVSILALTGAVAFVSSATGEPAGPATTAGKVSKSACGPAQGSARNASPAGKVVFFQGDGSLGTLFLSAPNQEFIQIRNCKELGPAKGKVVVPVGKWLVLKLDCLARDLSPLRHLAPDDLAYIDFNRATVPDAAFANIAHLSGIHQLDCSHTSIGDRALSFMRKLSSLERLDLGDTEVSDQGISSLSELSNLHILQVDSPRFTGAGLASLTKLPQLQLLALRGPTISDQALKTVSRFQHLLMLYLDNTAPTLNGIVALKDMTRLHTLWLCRSDLDDRAMLTVGRLINLRTLSLRRNPRITDTGLAQLANLQALTDLDISETGASDRSLHYIKDLPLTQLKLPGTRITDAGLKELEQKKTLAILFLPDKVSKAGAANLRQSLPACKVFRQPQSHESILQILLKRRGESQ